MSSIAHELSFFATLMNPFPSQIGDLRRIPPDSLSNFGLHFLPVGPGGIACEPLEKHAHIFDVLKACQLSDLFQGKIRFEKQLPDFIDLNAANFRLRRAAKVMSEFFLQLTARGIGMFNNLFNADSMTRPLADKTEGRGDIAVVDGHRGRTR